MISYIPQILYHFPALVAHHSEEILESWSNRVEGISLLLGIVQDSAREPLKCCLLRRAGGSG